ncbi:hypothetical protein HAX54_022649, partial [Datura stramonium]|nr:hypothetical protein [Datura stramonium]
MDLDLIVAIKEQVWQKGIEETSVVEVGIAQAHLCYGLRNVQVEATHEEAQHTRPMSLEAAQCTGSVQTTRDSNLSSIRKEAAKPNSNPSGKNEGLIYYYIYPCL